MLKRLAQVNPPVPEFDAFHDDEVVTFVPLDAVWPAGNADFNRRAAKVDAANGYTRFLDGDILLPKITPTFEAGRVTVANLDTPLGAGTTELHVIRTSAEVDARYLSYWMRSTPFLQEGETTLEGVGNLRRVPQEWLEKTRLPVNGVAAQVQIADFLDRETAQIDALIEKQEALKRGLQERRVAMVNEAIATTTGAERTPLRTVAVIQSGLTLGKRHDGETLEFPYLRVANIQTGYVDLSEVKTVEVPADDARKVMLRPGDVLMTEGGDRAALGRGSLWNGEIDPCLHQNHVFAVRAKDDRLLAEYLVYVLEARGAREYFESTRRQTTNLSATNAGLVRAFRFTLPSIQEQRKIVSDLDFDLLQLTTLLAKTEHFIELARERRAALITAAVTGQLDIANREAA